MGIFPVLPVQGAPTHMSQHHSQDGLGQKATVCHQRKLRSMTQKQLELPRAGSAPVLPGVGPTWMELGTCAQPAWPLGQ